MNIVTWLSERSKLSAREIKIRLTGVILVLGFFLFVAIYAKTWEFPTLASTIVLGGFLYGLFRKDQGY